MFFLVSCGRKKEDSTTIETTEESSYDYASEEESTVSAEENLITIETTEESSYDYGLEEESTVSIEEDIRMQSQDSNYTSEGEPAFSSGKYRIVKVNSPVDIEVYNKEGMLVASIIEDMPLLDGELVSSINSDGEKEVYLPALNDYAIELTATGDDY